MKKKKKPEDSPASKPTDKKAGEIHEAIVRYWTMQRRTDATPLPLEISPPTKPPPKKDKE